MEVLKIGVIGLGVMGLNHINSINNIDNLKLTAVCDSRKDICDQQAKLNDAIAYYDVEKMFASKDIDAVLIATPHYSHTPLTKMAFEAGLHVLCEKPIAVHKEDAQKMLDAHKAYPELTFAVMFQMRTSAINKKIKFLLESGELGNIKRVNWIITDWFRTQAYYDLGGWRATWKGEGGGVLLNQCPHQLDLFQWFFGMPSKVRAFCSLGKYHNIEVEDDVTAYCEYKNGSTGVFITSTGEYPGTNRLEIMADKGRLVVENNKITFKRTEGSVDDVIKTSESAFMTPSTWDITIPTSDEVASHQAIIANFADSILNGTKLIAQGEEGMHSIELANAMLYSSIKEKTIELPLSASDYSKELKHLIANSKFVKNN